METSIIEAAKRKNISARRIVLGWESMWDVGGCGGGGHSASSSYSACEGVCDSSVCHFERCCIL